MSLTTWPGQSNDWATKLERTGRLPAVWLEIKPLAGGIKTIRIDNFISYNFSSSIVVPVDAFSFSFVYPGDNNPFNTYVEDGDICTLYADDIVVCTGIVDKIEIEVDGTDAEKVTISGRDMLSQLEDNNAIGINKAPIYGGSYTVEQSANALIAGTRIKSVKTEGAPTTATLFATAIGESRLSALIRHCEPVNALFWSDPTGNLVVGLPAFNAYPSGVIQVNRDKRKSNALSIRATQSSTSIPNYMLVLWSDVQASGVGLPAAQIFPNAAQGPTRLRKAKHFVIKAVQVSMPSGADAQSLQATARFAAGNVLEGYAKRELAKANFNELLVSATVPGHFNENGELYLPNTVYNVDFDRANINEKMYLYGVEWNLTMERGAFSVLSFCRLNTIVSDAAVI